MTGCAKGVFECERLSSRIARNFKHFALPIHKRRALRAQVEHPHPGRLGIHLFAALKLCAPQAAAAPDATITEPACEACGGCSV